MFAGIDDYHIENVSHFYPASLKPSNTHCSTLGLCESRQRGGGITADAMIAAGAGEARIDIFRLSNCFHIICNYIITLQRQSTLN